jgi:hypothetical protein
MKSIETLQPALCATWCAADVIRRNLEQLVDNADREDFKAISPSRYVRWSVIGNILERDDNPETSRLLALWLMSRLFCDLLREQLGKEQTRKTKRATVPSKTRHVTDYRKSAAQQPLLKK